MNTERAAPRPPMWAALLRLAWPVALGRLGIMGMGVADTILVGQLAPDELPHQALGWAPTGVLLVTAIGLLTGVQVLGARAIGEGRPEAAGRVWRKGLAIAAASGVAAALLVALGVGPLLLALGVPRDLAEPAAAVAAVLGLSVGLHLAYVASAYFLESVQRPAPATVVMWLANGVNIAFNLWWIPEHGAIGSAWATVAARLFLAGVLIGFILWSPSLRAYGPGRFGAAGAPNFRALLQVGVAAAASQAAEAGAFSSMTVIAGRISESAVAAYTILLNLLAVVFMIALGLASATAVLTSEAIGRGAPREAAAAGWIGLALNTAAMLIVGLGIAAFAAPLGRAFTADLLVAGLVAAAAPLAALIMPPDGAQVVAAAALRARGDNWFPTASHVLAYVFVMPPLGFWLGEAQGAGVGGLMWAIFWASVLSIAVLAARMRWLERAPVQPPRAAS